MRIISIQVYIPCILFVSLSWFSFIVDPSSNGRMSLLIILLLVVINVFTSQPRHGVETRHDIYLLTCIMFIVAATLEYAVILALGEFHK